LAVSGLGALVCVAGISFLLYELHRAYGWAVAADKDHAAAYTSMIAAIASMLGAFISAMVNLFNALGQRSLESLKLELQRSLETLKLELQKSLEAHKVSLTQSASRAKFAVDSLIELNGSLIDRRSVLSLMEIGTFTNEQAKAAEVALNSARRRMIVLNAARKRPILEFLQEGENMIAEVRANPKADQQAIWTAHAKTLGTQLEAAERTIAGKTSPNPVVLS